MAYIIFGVKIKIQFLINNWVEVNTYSVKSVLAELGKNTQLVWVELSLAWSGFISCQPAESGQALGT